MIQDLLIPEEFLQLDQLKSAIELSDDTSFFSIIGIDTQDLSSEFDIYFKQNFSEITLFHPTSDNIFQDILETNQKNKFLYINLYEKQNVEFIKNLLFYRDFISDYDLQVIIFVNNIHYDYILKNAIDLYTISTLNYNFTTYKVDIVESVDREDLDKLLKEYNSKKKNISKRVKAKYLFDIAVLYSKYGENKLSLKYFNEVLLLSNKLKNKESIISAKFQLCNHYIRISKFDIANKYLLECKDNYFKTKNLVNLKSTLKLLIVLYFELSDIEKAEKFINELYLLSEKTNDDNFKLVSLEYFITFYNKKGLEKKAKEYFDKTFELATKLNDSSILNELNQEKAVECMNKNDFINAIKYLNKCIEFYKSDKNIFMLNIMYSKLAYIYYGLNDYYKSLIYCKFCYKYFEKNNIKDELLRISQYIAFVRYSQNDTENALRYINESLHLSKDLNKQKEIYFNYKYKSQIYSYKYDFKTALDCLDKAFKYVSDDISDISSRYSDVYKDLGEIDNAYYYFQKIPKESVYYKENTSYLDELYGEILLKDNKVGESLSSFTKSLKLARKKNDNHRINSVEFNLGFVYKKLNNIPMARKYFMEVLNRLEIINKDDRRIKTIYEELKSLK